MMMRRTRNFENHTSEGNIGDVRAYLFWLSTPISYTIKYSGEEDEALEEDDLDLLEENTGASFKKNRLTRLRRGRESESPPAVSSSKRRAVVESSDEDIDNESRPVPDIHNIWDDGRDEEDDDMDMDDFIDYDEEEDGGVPMDEKAREKRRREKRQEQERRKRARGARPEVEGIDAK